jgi:hypothetical protein
MDKKIEARNLTKSNKNLYTNPQKIWSKFVGKEIGFGLYMFVVRCDSNLQSLLRFLARLATFLSHLIH